jgi:hypothetical protein
MYLERRPEVGKEAASVEVEIAWSGELFASRTRSRDPQGVMGEKREGTLEGQPWELRVKTKEYYYVYNPVTHTVFVHASADTDDPYLQLHPFNAWMVCCPPGRRGRPLVDYIGAFRQPPGEKPSTFEFIRIDTNTIRQVRRDAYVPGGISEMDFDMSKCGNVVRTKYTLPGRKEPIEQATYRWRKIGTACVPVSIHYVGRVDAGPKSPRTQEISLQVRAVDLRGELDSYFTKDRLFKELPPDTLIDDRVRNRRYLLHPEHGIGVREFDGLSSLIKSRGFMKK